MATPFSDSSPRRKSRFFPPPFRIDHLSPPPKKPRLQFTSQIPPTVQQLNPDGSESFDWTRYQATLRLRSKWENIFEKFKHAHLEEQDELYLGKEIRVVKDRGTLRRVTEPIEFGCFHIKDEDLVDLVRREDVSDEEEHEWQDGQPYWGPEQWHPEQNETGEDPQLQEFLQAEARRREICGDEEEEDDAPPPPKRKYRRRGADTALDPQETQVEKEVVSCDEVETNFDLARKKKRSNLEAILAQGDKVPYQGISGLKQLLDNPPEMGKRSQAELPPTPPRTRSSASISADSEEDEGQVVDEDDDGEVADADDDDEEEEMTLSSDDSSIDEEDEDEFPPEELSSSDEEVEEQLPSLSQQSIRSGRSLSPFPTRFISPLPTQLQPQQAHSPPARPPSSIPKQSQSTPSKPAPLFFQSSSSPLQVPAPKIKPSPSQPQRSCIPKQPVPSPPTHPANCPLSTQSIIEKALITHKLLQEAEQENARLQKALIREKLLEKARLKSQPAAPPSSDSEPEYLFAVGMEGCPGQGVCTKSLCMMCGGVFTPQKKTRIKKERL